MELLQKLYYDAETGFQSKEKLYKKAKEIDKKITLEMVKKFLDEQAISQVTKQVTKNKIYETIVSPSVRNNYQMDIMYLPNPTLNKNYKYLLTCIDVYSRFAFVKPLKNKTGDEIFTAFKELIKEFGRPKNLNVDEGKEFTNKVFQSYCENSDIDLWFSDTQQENKNAIIERFHRTLRNLILAYTTSIGNSYIDALPKLIKNYNSSYHKTVKAKPIEIWDGKKINKQSVKLIPLEFKEGDTVRHIIKKKAFDKHSSTANYTKKVYTITKIIGNSIFLDDLTKPFRQFELIKAVGENMTTEYDDKINEENRQKTINRRLKKAGIFD